jgi:hypothetical protein
VCAHCLKGQMCVNNIRSCKSPQSAESHLTVLMVISLQVPLGPSKKDPLMVLVIMSLQVPLGPSKKDPLVRRRELLGSGKGSLAARLLAAVTDAAAALLHGKNSGDLISEALRGGSDGAAATPGGAQKCMLGATDRAGS